MPFSSWKEFSTFGNFNQFKQQKQKTLLLNLMLTHTLYYQHNLNEKLDD